MKKIFPQLTPCTGQKLFTNLILFGLLSTSILTAPAQVTKPKYPVPPPSMGSGEVSIEPQANPSQATARRHIDLVKLQADADEMSELAQTIPADMASVRHNIFPKDMLKKLKRIEKLSKHLRRELTP